MLCQTGRISNKLSGYSFESPWPEAFVRCQGGSIWRPDENGGPVAAVRFLGGEGGVKPAPYTPKATPKGRPVHITHALP